MYLSRDNLSLLLKVRPSVIDTVIRLLDILPEVDDPIEYYSVEEIPRMKSFIERRSKLTFCGR